MIFAIILLIFLGTCGLVARYPSQKKNRGLKWLLVGIGVALTIGLAFEVWF